MAGGVNPRTNAEEHFRPGKGRTTNCSAPSGRDKMPPLFRGIQPRLFTLFACGEPPRFRQGSAPRLVAAPDAASPLPGGEGEGEGEGYAANQNGPTNFARSTRPAPQGTKPALLPRTPPGILADRD